MDIIPVAISSVLLGLLQLPDKRPKTTDLNTLPSVPVLWSATKVRYDEACSHCADAMFLRGP